MYHSTTPLPNSIQFLAANLNHHPFTTCTPQSLQSGSRFHIGPHCIPGLSLKRLGGCSLVILPFSSVMLMISFLYDD